MDKANLVTRSSLANASPKSLVSTLTGSGLWLILACGACSSVGDGTGASASDTDSSDDPSTGPGVDDFPPAVSTACEIFQGDLYEIENLPDAHGWQASQGPTCPGVPNTSTPPCWGGRCFETILATGCSESLGHPPGFRSDTAVYVIHNKKENSRDVHRFLPSSGSWESLRVGTDEELLAGGVYADSWILTSYLGASELGIDLRRIDPSSGLVSSFASRPYSPYGPAPQQSGVGFDDGLVFDSALDNLTGPRALCRWRFEPAGWETLAASPDATAAYIGAELHGEWIYWANERVHAETHERQVLFENSDVVNFYQGSTVIDERLWLLVGSNCQNTEAGCVEGGVGGLYYVDFAGPPSEYPKKVDIQANAYNVPQSRLETDGERLYWQRLNYEDPSGIYLPQLVAYDPVAEELEVIFEFEDWSVSLSNYQVVGGYLYGFRKDANGNPIGNFERLSLAAP